MWLRVEDVCLVLGEEEVLLNFKVLLGIFWQDVSYEYEFMSWCLLMVGQGKEEEDINFFLKFKFDMFFFFCQDNFRVVIEVCL